jgi:intracellular proteinase inhibitor BsuPI
MRLLLKVAILLLLLPAWVLAQPGVRMSSDFLPLEVGNRWTYDLFNEGGQKIGTLEFGVQERRIVEGRSFYLLTQFPFIEDGSLIKLVRYDRQERQYMRVVDSEEGPLFLADGARVEVVQADDSGLPVKFTLHGDLTDFTFQRGMGIIEARMHFGKDVQIAKLTALRTSDRKASEAAAQGAPTLPQPKTPEQRTKGLADNVAKPSEDTVALDVQATQVSGGTKFVLTVINSTEKLVPFSFRSGQTYDFAVVDASTNQEVWRWSRRMYFSQVLRQEALRPSRNWTFEVMWNHRDNDLNIVTPGKYKVTGSLAIDPLMESEPVTFDIK